MPLLMENRLMDKVCFSIDDHQIVADKGTSILKAVLENDIYIPHLCYHSSLKPKSVCRLCMVEVNDGKLVLACRTLAEDGMKVKTGSPAIDRAVRPIVELLIADHHTSCRECHGKGKCELQKIMAHFHIDRQRVRRLRPPKAELPLENLNNFLDYDSNKCVRCGICVQTCDDIFSAKRLYFVDRGYETKIAFFGDKSHCDFCQECVERCPVGVLIFRNT
jgi:NADH dehydrogenase/NADH:ubiquinone oxidoreductase subunit G